MKFKIPAAATAALLCVSTLAFTGAPGFALMPDKPSLIPSPVLANTSAPLPVPSPSPVEPSFDVGPVATPAVPARPAVADQPVSLAAAVATQAMPGTISDDLRCLATAIYHEAKGEPLIGQLGVAHVILNRTRSGRFPRTVCGVVTQPGQFSFVRAGHMTSPGEGNKAYRTALSVAQLAMADKAESPVAAALYFHATHVSPNWGRQRVATIGRHIFYR